MEYHKLRESCATSNGDRKWVGEGSRRRRWEEKGRQMSKGEKVEQFHE